MTRTLRAKFDGRVLIPEGQVDLPTDRVLELHVESDAAEPTIATPAGLQRLVELAAKYPPNPESPRDGAAQHDHYLYGTPKRDNP